MISSFLARTSSETASQDRKRSVTAITGTVLFGGTVILEQVTSRSRTLTGFAMMVLVVVEIVSLLLESSLECFSGCLLALG